MNQEVPLTVDDTFVALKRRLSEATELHYEFEGKFETARGKYDVQVLCEYFGAYINYEGKVDVHIRILSAVGLPKIHDDELIGLIHERIIEILTEGDPDMEPGDMVVVPTIEDGAITHVDDYLDKVEVKVLDLFKDSDLGAVEAAELLNRMLDRMIGAMTSQNSKDAEVLEGIMLQRYVRDLSLIGRERSANELNYIG